MLLSTELLPTQVERSHAASLMDSMEVARLGSFEEARPLREEWDGLVERLGGDVFGTFDWCATWWNHFGHGRTLCLFVGRCGGRLAAIWPMFREKLWWGPMSLRVVRVMGCDHGVTTCNVYTQPGFEEAMVREVLAELERGGGWDFLHVGEIPGYAKSAAELAAAFRSSPKVRSAELDGDAYPHAVFEVPADFEEYLSRISIKERRNVRRDERQMLQRGGEVRQPANTSEIEGQLSAMMHLHREHWKLRGRMGHFDDVPGIGAFYRDVAFKALPNGRLGMLEVRAGGDVLAAEMALRFNGRLHWIIGGRREDVTARVGFCCLMRKAITDRVSLIDGLAGEYDYKRRLGAAQLSLKNLYVLPHGATSALRIRATRLVLRLVSLVYHKVWFWRIAPWIMRRAPHLGAVIVPHGLWERFARSRFLVADRRPVSQASVDEGDPD